MCSELEEFFWSRVDRSGGPDACWPWLRCRVGGYGQFRRDGVKYYAHRIAYELTFGSADGLEVRHSCDNPPCCNPRHLIAGTHAENMADMVRRGRHGSTRHPECRPRGDRQYRAKLGEADVRAIRERGNESKRALAREFDVSTWTIDRILKRLSWKHVEG